jgi:glycosyltransferase involved in cell wall biosynthesis
MCAAAGKTAVWPKRRWLENRIRKAFVKILYILPHPDFFNHCNGVAGHIAHANGVLEAFSHMGASVDVVAHAESPLLAHAGCTTHAVSLSGPGFVARQRWSLALLKQCRQLVASGEYDLCYIRYSVGFAQYLPSLKRLLKGVPLIMEVNSFGAQRHSLFGLVERRVFRCADMLIAVSDKLAKTIGDLLRPASAVLVVPNGVSVSRINTATIAKARGAAVRVGYAGILKPQYGLDLLIDGHKKLLADEPTLELHVYGDGPYLQTMKEMAVGIPNIHLHGGIPFADVPAKLAELDILVYTTSGFNAFQSPIKMYEYMGAGAPIVAAETPQTRELVGAEERGLLYPIGDLEAYVRQMKRLLDEPQLGATLATNAHREVLERHTWVKRMDGMLAEAQNRKVLVSK